MKYDDASWHYTADDFPKGLDPVAGATHIGMFVAWVAAKDLLSEEILRDWSSEVAALKARETMPGQFVWKCLEGKLSSHDLSPRGELFANAYYAVDGEASYLGDYVSFLKVGYESEYFLPDDWQTYEKVSSVITKRFQSWMNMSSRV